MNKDEARKANQVQDGDCYTKAKARGQMTFSLVEQDMTAVQTIAFWILLNVNSAPEEKLRAAFDDMMVMREFKGKKKAD